MEEPGAVLLADSKYTKGKEKERKEMHYLVYLSLSRKSELERELVFTKWQ